MKLVAITLFANLFDLQIEKPYIKTDGEGQEEEEQKENKKKEEG